MLFQFITIPKKETQLLAIPENCAEKIFVIYHVSLFAGHQKRIKTYLTTGDKFLYEVIYII